MSEPAVSPPDASTPSPVEPPPPAPTPATHASAAPKESLALRAGPLLAVVAALAVVGAIVSGIVAPGMRGNAAQHVVERWDLVADALACLVYPALVVANAWGAVEIARSPAPNVPRVALLFASTSVVTFGALALFTRFTPVLAVQAVAAAILALRSAWHAVRTPHTRAVAAVLFAFGAAALFRIAAWELAAAAGERASVGLYAAARGLATAGIALEGLGQLVAAAWLGTRGRVTGRIASNAAIALAFVLTWGAARGVHAGAPMWQAALHTALADAAGTPPPYVLGAVATFLTTASMLLAGVALVQRGTIPLVGAVLALALLARGTLDVPAHALAIAAAAQWALVAALDPRAMWTSLHADRARRLAEEGAAR